MRNIVFFVLLLLGTVFGAAAKADQAVCKTFFDNMQGKVNTVLKDKNISFVKKRSALTTIFENVVDVEWIAQAVTENYWKTSTEQERSEFINAYKPYLSDHYIGGLDEQDYNEMLSLVVTDFKPTDKAAYVVHAQVKKVADEPMNFDLRLEEQPQGVCHVRDFSIDGVSQVSTQRDEIQVLAAKGGLKYVTQKLLDLMQAK